MGKINANDYATFDDYLSALITEFSHDVARGACLGCGNCDGGPCEREYKILLHDAEKEWARKVGK